MKRKKTSEALRYRMLAGWMTSGKLDADLRQRLAAFRVAHAKGNRSAVEMALRLMQPSDAYDEELVPVPVWLLDATLTAIEDETRGVDPAKGRHARPAAELLDDFVDLVRAHHVMLARGDGERGEDAFEEASAALRGTPAAGAAGTMRKSLKRFQQRRRTEPWRYVGLGIALPEAENLGDT